MSHRLLGERTGRDLWSCQGLFLGDTLCWRCASAPAAPEALCAPRMEQHRPGAPTSWTQCPKGQGSRHSHPPNPSRTARRSPEGMDTQTHAHTHRYTQTDHTHAGTHSPHTHTTHKDIQTHITHTHHTMPTPHIHTDTQPPLLPYLIQLNTSCQP